MWNRSWPVELAASGTDEVQVYVSPRCTSVGWGSDSSQLVRGVPG
jgi:hypothetical protein